MSDEMKELQSLVLEIAKQNIALGQRIDSQGQRIDAVNQAMVQQNAQLNQAMAQQNTQLNQRIDILAQRMDSAIAQMQQQHQEVTKLTYAVINALERLPDVAKEQIGFKPKP
jgi:uncharacterized protein YgfB (UPF0149 family)